VGRSYGDPVRYGNFTLDDMTLYDGALDAATISQLFSIPEPASLAIIALATGSPVLPASSWREPDGSHVLRVEPPLPVIAGADPDDEIRRNTRAYNQALERLVMRHPEQWWWVHRRWKPHGPRSRPTAGTRR